MTPKKRFIYKYRGKPGREKQRPSKVSELKKVNRLLRERKVRQERLRRVLDELDTIIANVSMGFGYDSKTIEFLLSERVSTTEKINRVLELSGQTSQAANFLIDKIRLRDTLLKAELQKREEDFLINFIQAMKRSNKTSLGKLFNIVLPFLRRKGSPDWGRVLVAQQLFLAGLLSKEEEFFWKKMLEAIVRENKLPRKPLTRSERRRKSEK
jgi:hypothetical protein